MPGVVVNTAVRSAPTTTTVAPASTFFVVGTSQRGPLDAATLITSLAQFEATYGTYVAARSLHQQVRTFFEEGGSQVYVVRVSDAVESGDLILLDTFSNPALTLTAANVGAWSDLMTADVSEGALVDTFKVTVYFDGEEVYATDNVATAGAAAADLNNSPVAQLYLTASASNASAVLEVASAEPFSGGIDDDDSVAASTFIGALDLFDQAYGSGAVAIPGQNGDDVRLGLIAHGVATNRIALLAVDPAATDIDTVVLDVANVRAADNAEFAAIFYPSVVIPLEGGTSASIPPEGFAAAKRSLAVNATGTWQAFAGVQSQASFVTGTSEAVTQAYGDLLDNAGVNAIRVIQNTVRIYGARSASTDTENFRYITARDTLNYIAALATASLEDLVFSTIDGRRSVFGRVEARLIGILEPMRSAGGLYEGFAADGRQIDPGYSVEVSDNLNPVTQLADGVVRAKVGVRVSSTGDRIILDVIKSNLTSSVV